MAGQVVGEVAVQLGVELASQPAERTHAKGLGWAWVMSSQATTTRYHPPIALSDYVLSPQLTPFAGTTAGLGGWGWNHSQSGAMPRMPHHWPGKAALLQSPDRKSGVFLGVTSQPSLHAWLTGQGFGEDHKI